MIVYNNAMLHFTLNIANPFSKDCTHRTFWDFYRKLSKNKAIEIEVTNDSPYSLLYLNVDLSWRGRDHAGFGFDISIMRYSFHFSIYDVRHWNYDTGTWEKPDTGSDQ